MEKERWYSGFVSGLEKGYASRNQQSKWGVDGQSYAPKKKEEEEEEEEKRGRCH